MIFYIIGVDYKIASLEVREPLHTKSKDAILFWERLEKEFKLKILLTCNRIELYGLTNDNAEVDRVKQVLDNFSEVFKNAYVKRDRKEVYQHALSLACGLRSQLLGEDQIFEQLSSWVWQDSFPEGIREEWSKILDSAQIIKEKSAINFTRPDIARLIFRDLIRRIKYREDKRVLVVGTGRLAQLLAIQKPSGINLLFVSKKKHQKAKQLAKISKGEIITLKELGKFILNVDALVSATSSPHYVLGKEHFSNLLKRELRPLYAYDLAVPRDIDPQLKNAKGIFLQDLDDLSKTFDNYNKEAFFYVQETGRAINETIDFLMGGCYVRSSANRHTAKCACLSSS